MKTYKMSHKGKILDKIFTEIALEHNATPEQTFKKVNEKLKSLQRAEVIVKFASTMNDAKDKIEITMYYKVPSQEEGYRFLKCVITL